jgi:ABC-type transport system substrate-binding protein
MKTADGTVSFSQDGEPVSLDCADETDGNSFRVCDTIFDKLYEFAWGSAEGKPALAEKCEGNGDATEWTCTLKQGVKFSNGASFDANDVVASWARGWDSSNPLHVGNSGAFQYFKDFFGPKILNEPPEPTATP